MFVSVPSLHDRGHAPAGHHTALSDRCLDHLAHYATNLTRANVLDRFGQTPLDVERHLPNMHGGDIVCGEMNEHQVLDRRPFPECSQYRTPIGRLYLCGASSHPGGNITGANGYNAAGQICRDLGLDPWWKPVDSRAHWDALATSGGAPSSASNVPTRAIV